jgi:hypothetical protein
MSGRRQSACWRPPRSSSASAVTAGRRSPTSAPGPEWRPAASTRTSTPRRRSSRPWSGPSTGTSAGRWRWRWRRPTTISGRGSGPVSARSSTWCRSGPGSTGSCASPSSSPRGCSASTTSSWPGATPAGCASPSSPARSTPDTTPRSSPTSTPASATSWACAGPTGLRAGGSRMTSSTTCSSCSPGGSPRPCLTLNRDQDQPRYPERTAGSTLTVHRLRLPGRPLGPFSARPGAGGRSGGTRDRSR